MNPLVPNYLPTERYKALPVQIIESGETVVLKRGCVEIQVGGERAIEAVRTVLEATSSVNGASGEEVCGLFAAPDRPSIDALVRKLVADRILVPQSMAAQWAPDGETHLDIFYWNINTKKEDVIGLYDNEIITFIGINDITNYLLVKISECGFSKFEVVDYPLLRNTGYFSDSGEILESRWACVSREPLSYEDWSNEVQSRRPTCIVASSDFGGLHLMRGWNEYCVSHGVHFLPIVLQNMIGYVGPFVVPGETACFECFRGRQNSNMTDPSSQRAAEYAAHVGQATVGYHPAMAAVLADIAAMELTKFYSGALPFTNAGTVIEVSLLEPAIAARKILKIPRCTVCSPLLRKTAVGLDPDGFHSADRGQ